MESGARPLEEPTRAGNDLCIFAYCAGWTAQRTLFANQNAAGSIRTAEKKTVFSRVHTWKGRTDEQGLSQRERSARWHRQGRADVRRRRIRVVRHP
ncbi:hypothetical protein BG57_09030 [Caballeronia grimmiae]|uniref:Uncharacterized protein n=1 Tax=Caballeronia grimmiae TaxID=1071679 RepID=A0A069NYH2_9BURK|nr:hypothetical protein BG57_09030 [Caballeronia grimmiae]